jgi:predicted Rdx family selenoprotein
LAAAIEDNFGTTAILKEGYGGIFEITVNSDLIYSNKKEGGKFPEKGVILQEISKYKAPLPGREIKEKMSQDEGAAPSCKWPP